MCRFLCRCLDVRLHKAKMTPARHMPMPECREDYPFSQFRQEWNSIFACATNDFVQASISLLDCVRFSCCALVVIESTRQQATERKRLPLKVVRLTDFCQGQVSTFFFLST
jgi:hypothetical protein